MICSGIQNSFIFYFAEFSYFLDPFIRLAKNKKIKRQKDKSQKIYRQSITISDINNPKFRTTNLKSHKHSMAYPHKASWGSFSNPEYTRLQTQIEQQTLSLLRERQNLSNHLTSNYVDEPYLKAVESQKYIKLNSDRSNRNTENSRQVISNKVKELMDLCKGENSAFSNQLIKVLGEERNIYNDLVNSNSNKESSQKTQYFGVSNPIIEAQKQSTVVHSQQRLISNRSTGHQSPSKLNVGAKTQPKDTVQANGKGLSGEELIQMIEEIERKALNEIEKLREEKIDLMKQLKQEIQSNNELQKEINQMTQDSRNQRQSGNLNSTTPFKQYQFDGQVQIQKQSFQEELFRQIRTEMDYLRRQNENLKQMGLNFPQSNSMSEPIQSSNEVYSLRQTISVLEEELRNRDETIRKLSVQVNRLYQQQGGSSSNYQVSSLLEQGEAIRQNTLHLIRLKEGQSGIHSGQPSYNQTTSLHESQRIRQLQELLQRQEEEKQNFLQDLLLFKQKYQQLEEQNKQLKRHSSKLGNSDIARFSPIYDKSSSIQGVGASIEEYEKLLSQMKGYSSKY